MNKGIGALFDAEDVTSKVIGPFVSPAAWEAVPAFEDLLVQTENGVPEPRDKEERERRLLACIERASHPDAQSETVTKGFIVALSFGCLIQAAEPSEIHYRRFGKVLDELLEAQIVKGKMSPIVFLPLATERVVDLSGPKKFPPQCVLFALLHFDETMSREKLNERVGFEAFFYEGGLPEEWPPV